jgi:hypothetical protein
MSRKLNLGHYDADSDSVYLFAGSFFNHQEIFLKKIYAGGFYPQELSRENLVKKHLLVLDVYFTFLPTLAKYLNEKNQTDYSLKYWHTFLAFSVCSVIDSLIDKKLKIEQFLNSSNETFVFESLNTTKTLFQDDYSFNNASVQSIELNHYYSSLAVKCLNLSKVKIAEKEANIFLDLNPNKGPGKYQTFEGNIEYIPGFSGLGKKILNLFINKETKKSPAIFPHKLSHSAAEINFLNWEEILIQSLPLSYLNLKKMNISSITKTGPVLFSSYKYPEEKRAWVSGLRETGSRVYLTQHGSSYGDLLVTTKNYLTEYLLDGFISWGWKDHQFHPANIIAGYSPLLSKLKLRSWIPFGKSKKIILVSTVYAPNEATSSVDSADFYQEYLDNLRQFFQHLDEETKKYFWYRPRLTHSNGTYNDALVKIIKEEFPWIRFLQGSLDKEMTFAGLVIHDNSGSAFQKSLVMGVPTLFMWRENSVQFNEQLHSLWQDLKRESIYFSNGKNAAQFINKNYPQINTWWKSPKVKNLVNQLENSMYKTSFFPLAKWISLLRKL